MARRRRRSYRRYARRAARRIYRGGGKAGMGKVIGNVVDGAIVGAVQNFIPNDALGGMADSLVPIGVGWIRKNDTLMTIGGYQLGLKLASSFASPSSANKGVY